MKTCSTVPLRSLSDDAYLRPYLPIIDRRHRHALTLARTCAGTGASLADWASGHEFYGLHRTADGWVLREWAPNATHLFMISDSSDWRESESRALKRLNAQGDWELHLPAEALQHGDLYRLRLHWNGGAGDRIPAYARRVVQDARTHIFNAQVWRPATPYIWRHDFRLPRPFAPLVYETHVGMAQEEGKVGTYAGFQQHVLPRIVAAGYNTIQLMAVMEHPYYGSFGYHVSSYFAASSRFGTPEELKALIDAAHGAGLAVTMDIIHSHAVRNEAEGLGRFDGTRHQYFHEGPRGEHQAWDSLCFDYGKGPVLHFLLSNCRFWLDEYHFDGFRFDGVTSMLYHHHGLGPAFTSYDAYFGSDVDEEALAYLTLANQVIHEVRPDAITTAEDVSGMPGLGAPRADGGIGFDFRLAMGIPDMWFKVIKESRDEDWSLDFIWHELTNRRADERTISYAESHDQALVGGKTLAFELMDAAMYHHMHRDDRDLTVDRGLALHKMIRLATLATAGHGYLNFMGNEFGHPEWVDFPREGNDWSYHYARRQWSLRDSPELKFRFLGDFDRAMMQLAAATALAGHEPPVLRHRHADDKVLVFERRGLLFAFNFHPNRSFTDYTIAVSPGTFRLVLTTDAPEFGGHDRLTAGERHVTLPGTAGDQGLGRIQLYLPARTALVLQRA